MLLIWSCIIFSQTFTPTQIEIEGEPQFCFTTPQAKIIALQLQIGEDNQALSTIQEAEITELQNLLKVKDTIIKDMVLREGINYELNTIKDDLLIVKSNQIDDVTKELKKKKQLNKFFGAVIMVLSALVIGT